jgi:hypothetical protein
LLGAKKRPIEQIRQELASLDASIRALPADETFVSQRTLALRAEWERLRAELAAAESAAASH